MQYWLHCVCLCAALLALVESRSAPSGRLSRCRVNPRLAAAGRACGVFPRYTLAAAGIGDLFGYLDRVRSRNVLHRQLSEVPIYVVTDAQGKPVLSYYPFDDAAADVPTSPSTPPKQSVKRMPETAQISEQFAQMFATDAAGQMAQTTVHDLSQMKRRIPRVVLYFVDPSACAAQVQELRRQGQDAYVGVATLSDYVRQAENSNRDSDPILLPAPEALTRATQNGKHSFRGTPVFTTEPPIVITGEQSGATEFNPATDKFCVFLSPENAVAMYRGAWWTGSGTTEMGGRTVHYRILPGPKPWSPRIRAASLEDLCRRIQTSEPFWATLLQFAPPGIALDENTKQLLRNEIRH
ncbi:glycosyltransferase involved in glycosylation of HMW1A and HMW2A, putative [Babesia caballi]|uniref:Glycosyltransferase involved in glycosylation of HMW1A and HMW2A, putative n=1 Tax=Babesia caballi TaxID=5871 RepID=A0AAV4LVY3_BABCB|nr:glycosyltransferase involved in glycosylation of HMW1A and HMW2A, putative [Babesia caballi]